MLSFFKKLLLYRKSLYFLLLGLSILPLFFQGAWFSTRQLIELCFYFVISTSLLPVLIWFVKKRPSIFKDAFGRLLLFRVLTDLCCVLAELVLHNSNPPFYFTLPINAILILTLFHKHLQTNFSTRFFQFSLVLIACAFFYQLRTIPMASSEPFMNLLTYPLIVLFGIGVIYQSKDSQFVQMIVFPLCAYYAPLFFYALFEAQVARSSELYNQLFFMVAPLALGLNLFFSRAVWLGEYAHKRYH